MSHSVRLFSISLAALAVVRSATASVSQPVIAFPAESEGRVDGRERLRIGSSRGAVLLILGDPDARLDEDHWIFWRFRAHPGSANPQRFDALVLSFAGDLVSGMKLADAQSLRRFLSQPRLPLGE